MTTNLMKQFMEDAVEAPNNDELSEISKLAALQASLMLDIELLNQDLTAKTEHLRQVQEDLLPNAMAAVGMSKFTTTDGYSITIKDDIYASIRKDFINDAVGWLDENGLGGIIKDQVAVDFGRGEFNNVNELMVFCKANGFSASEKLSVHPMTLKATIKEQMAKGMEFPEEFFSVAPVRKAIIKTK